MKVRLTRFWTLTDQQSNSLLDNPVLVCGKTGDTFCPEDVLEPYPFWGTKTAAAHVTRMSNMEEHTDKEWTLIRRFTLARPG